MILPHINAETRLIRAAFGKYTTSEGTFFSRSLFCQLEGFPWLYMGTGTVWPYVEVLANGTMMCGTVPSASLEYQENR